MTNDELIDLWREKHKIDRKQAPTLLELMDLCESARIAGLEAAIERTEAYQSVWRMPKMNGEDVYRRDSAKEIKAMINQMIPKESV